MSVSNQLDMPVDTVERRESTVAKTAAAVYVITNEMIKRSGARNIPEALRYVPGLQVARINADNWAISIRGFNGQFSSKILVQIDGVAIFQPINNGVYWDQEFVMLEDVDRIEIVRGPGGAIWGMNAVNGVINIITKSSKDTVGAYADVGGGDQHKVFSNARVGGRQGNMTWRVWGTQNSQSNGFIPDSAPPGDALSTGQGGYRMDWQADQGDLITFEGDWLGGLAGGAGGISVDTLLDTAKTVLRWDRKFSEDSDQSTQVYYNYVNRTCVVAGILDNTNINTFDFDYKYHVNIADRHDVVVGAGFRNYTTQADYWYSPQGFDFNITNWYVQDTITLKKDFLYTTAGCKFSYDTITHFEYQPDWKIVMTPTKKTSIWASISRTVGLPSLLQLDIDDDRLPGIRIVGNPDLQAEDALSYEIGFRQQMTEKFYWDISVYFNRYDNMIDVAPPVIIAGVPTFIFQNIGHGDTYGFEWVGNYQVTDKWNLTGNYSLYRLTQTGMGALGYVYDFPRNMFNVRSGWDVGQNVKIDMGVRYVDALGDIREPSYLLGDVRVAWRPSKHLETSVVGQDLLGGAHPEFTSIGTATPTYTVSGWYGMLSYRY